MAEWEILSAILILAVVLVRKCCKGKISYGLQYGLWLVVLVRLLIPVTPVESSFSILNFLPQQWQRTDFDEDYNGEIIGKTGEQLLYCAADINVLRRIKDINVQITNDGTQSSASDGYYLEKNSYLTDALLEIPPGQEPDVEGIGQEPVETAYFSSSYSNSFEKTSYLVGEQTGENLGEPETSPKDGGIKPLSGMGKAGRAIFLIWLMGTGALAVFFGGVNLSFYLRLRKSAVFREMYGKLKVYDTGEVISPCLFGVFAPAIYLDYKKIVSEEAKEHILIHETMHYRHRDYIWALFRAVLLCAHWYNPLVWYVALTSAKDCELACDESVIKRIGEENRIAYGETLIQMIRQSSHISNVMCMATSMVGTKKSIRERIKSVAHRNRISKAALLFLAAALCVVTACTFTGKESNTEDKALIKEVKQKLFEDVNYTKTMKCKFCPADYDKDGEREVFLFVKTAEDSVDVLYYDDGEVEKYRTEHDISDMESDIYVMELSGKTFCVFDRTTEEKVISKVLGIRDGKIVNYFMDYKTAWENEKYINGRISFSQEKDIEVVTYNHLAAVTMNAGNREEQFCSMTEYYYYDKPKDAFYRYPVYQITRDEILAMKGGEIVLSDFEQGRGETSRHYTYAKVRDKIILMGHYYYSEDKEDYRYAVYQYDSKERGVGEFLFDGEGNYENLDSNSERRVSRYEQDKRNAFYKFAKEYEKGITCDGTILEHKEWLEGSTGYVRTCEWTKDNELLMHITEIPVVYENGVMHAGDKEPVRITYDHVTSREEFNKVYEESWGYVDIPDLFLNNIQADIGEKHIEKYMDDVETAFFTYFHVSGGRMREILWSSNFGMESADIVYEFADKQTITVKMYMDYQGVWAPFGHGSGYRSNLWYASCTEEDFRNAVPAEEFSFARFDWNGNVTLKKQIQPGIDVYYALQSSGMVVKNGDTETLLPIDYDIQNLPRFSVRDYDNDGTPEAAVINCTGRGTGCYTENVSVIESVYKPYDRVYRLDTWDVAAVIDEKLQVRFDKERKRISLELDTENEASGIEFSVASFHDELAKSGEGTEMGSIYYGDVGYMRCEGDMIICDMLLWYVPSGWVTGATLSEAGGEENVSEFEWVRAQFRYTGDGNFVFEDLFFVSEEKVRS